MFSFAAILILSFFLGMRHATDPDHVVAITTIVTKQRGIGKAALIGALWGLGHTFTIFVVGTMIILFQVTIPPRLGLSMEFAVAAMLILLGVLNLTGTLRWLQERFIPGTQVPGAETKDGDCDEAKAQPVGSPVTSQVIAQNSPRSRVSGSRAVQRCAATRHRRRAWPRRFSGCGPFGYDHHSRFLASHRLSPPLWCGHNCGDDANHRCNRPALCVHL